MSVSLSLNRKSGLLQEVVAYAETSMSRRISIIFLVKFDSETGEGADMDDNVRNQK
jgi:ATP-dependent DNA helicase RecQ